MSSLQAPRGTFDVLPADAARRAVLEEHARRILGAAGYGRIETPTFEATELFARGVGEATDIVQKEMYSFDDGGGRSLTLRPEGTAPVCARLPRARHAQAAPAGEALVPVELLPRRGAPEGPLPPVLAGRRGGDRRRRPRDRRRAHRPALRPPARGRGQGPAPAPLQPRAPPRRAASTARSWPPTCTRTRTGCRRRSSARIDLNPMRAFDASDPRTQETMRDAPILLDRLAPEDAEHFERVQGAARRRRDHATSSTPRWCAAWTTTPGPLFEFTSDALGAQSAVGGGGRYDGLIEQLGGPPTPGVGLGGGRRADAAGRRRAADPARRSSTCSWRSAP